jgi:hypothetical protein
MLTPCIEPPRRFGIRRSRARYKLDGKVMYASRGSWIRANGNPGKLHVLHTCDNGSCINLSHLYAGTNTDNVNDRELRNRGDNGASQRLICKFGHALTGQQVGKTKSGYQRYCLTCKCWRNRRYRAIANFNKQTCLDGLRNDVYEVKA